MVFRINERNDRRASQSITIYGNAKSFISIGVSYPRKAELPQQDKEDPFVQFCRSSWGMDYHEHCWGEAPTA